MDARAFNRNDDLRKLQAFLVEMRHRVDQAAYFQLGDLLWRMYDITHEDQGWRQSV